MIFAELLLASSADSSGTAVINSRTLFLQIKCIITVIIVHILIFKHQLNCPVVYSCTVEIIGNCINIHQDGMILACDFLVAVVPYHEI